MMRANPQKLSMKKLPQKSFKLGSYPIGFNYVDLWLDPHLWGGSFSWAREVGGNTKMVIGIADEKYGNTLAVTMHEAVEMCAVEMGLRFTPSDGEIEASDCYRFIMDHNQFSEVLARAAQFICAIQPDLMTYHSRYHPQK